MEEQERLARRFAFGAVAHLYDEHRPGYPAEVFDELADLADLRPGARVLEIGGGTGKATLEWVARGYVVTVVEPDPRMAVVVGDRTSDADPAVQVERTTFEEFVSDARFDLIAAAQSWHWVDPARGFEHAADLLAPGGWIGLFYNVPVHRGELAPALDAIYERRAPTIVARARGEVRGATEADWSAQLATAGRFGAAVERTFPWSQHYTTEAYVSLLRTHSDHALLQPADRDRLLADVADAVAAAGGEVTIGYECRLVAAPLR